MTRLTLLLIAMILLKIAPSNMPLIAIACAIYISMRVGRGQSRAVATATPKQANAVPAAPPIAPIRCDSADILVQRLEAQIIGQPLAARVVADTLYRRLHLARGSKPIGVFMFVGPPGVGKTHFAKVLNKELFSRSETLLHVDMSQYTQSQGAQQLFGAPRGYIGSERYGTLTAYLRDRPRSIILLDEFEKSHEAVQKRFLTAWNDGFVTEASDGQQVSTSEAIFVVTTNAAAERISDISAGLSGEYDEIQRDAISALRDAGFAPELLNRIDSVIPFLPLQGMDVARVVAVEIEQFFALNGLNIVGGGIDPEILIGGIERNERIGGTVRDISRGIENQLSDAVIAARQAGADQIALRLTDNQIEIEIHRLGVAEPRSLYLAAKL